MRLPKCRKFSYLLNDLVLIFVILRHWKCFARYKVLKSVLVIFHCSHSFPASVSAPFQPYLDPPSVMEMPVDPNEPTYCICHQVCFQKKKDKTNLGLHPVVALYVIS